MWLSQNVLACASNDALQQNIMVRYRPPCAARHGEAPCFHWASLTLQPPPNVTMLVASHSTAHTVAYCADVKLTSSSKGIVPRQHLAIKRMESDRAHTWAAQHLGHWWGSANCNTTGKDPKVALIRLERPPLSILACDSARFCGLCSL